MSKRPPPCRSRATDTRSRSSARLRLFAARCSTGCPRRACICILDTETGRVKRCTTRCRGNQEHSLCKPQVQSAVKSSPQIRAQVYASDALWRWRQLDFVDLAQCSDEPVDNEVFQMEYTRQSIAKTAKRPAVKFVGQFRIILDGRAVHAVKQILEDECPK